MKSVAIDGYSPVLETRVAVELYFYVGVAVEVFLPCKLRILTPHFEQQTGAKVFWGMFPFWCQGHAFYPQLRHVFTSSFFVQH
jgi:hypothetical protein